MLSRGGHKDTEKRKRKQKEQSNLMLVLRFSGACMESSVCSYACACSCVSSENN